MKKTVAMLVIILMAVGFDWSFSQRGGDIIKITLKNQFPVAVGFYVNDIFVCNAAANASCSVRVNINNTPFKIEAWGYDNRVIASRVFTSLERGKDIVWATGNVDLYAPAPQPAPPQPSPTKPVPSQSAPAQTIPRPAAQKGSTVWYMKSASTLSYQGQKTQNRVKTASLSKIERLTYSSGAAYALSGEGAVKLGQMSEIAFYGVSPVNVNRSAADRLYSDQKGLNPWLDIVNSTLNGLTHERMALGAWEESIKLPFGEGGPKMIQAQFRAHPLPQPDNKWILITADSGLMSFGALDPKYQDSLIYARYHGVLVYAPMEDEILQAAAAFTLYHGEDEFRIGQLHYAADANGSQLYPALDVGPYLDFAPVDPDITTPGAFPSWCIQAAHVLDFVHLAVMTAAEGSANQPGIVFTGQSFLNLIHHHFDFVKLLLTNGGAQFFLGPWQELLDWGRLQRMMHWDFWLQDVVSIDLPVRGLRMSGPGDWWVDINRPLYVAAKKMINGKMYDIGLINDFPYGAPEPSPQPAQGGLEKPTPSAEPPPPAAVKKPSGGGATIPLVLAGLGGAIYGAYELGLLDDLGLGGDDYPDLIFSFENASPQSISSFIINGQECGPIGAGSSSNWIEKVVTVPHSGSCTTINYSWRTSLNYTGSGSGRTNIGGAFTFDNFSGSPNAAPHFQVEIMACTGGRSKKRQD